jgi:hypothetical protein
MAFNKQLIAGDTTSRKLKAGRPCRGGEDELRPVVALEVVQWQARRRRARALGPGKLEMVQDGGGW